MNQGALHFEATLNTRQLETGFDKLRKEIRSAAGFAEKETAGIDYAFKNLASGIAGYFSGQALMGFTRELINVRGEFQKTEIAFGTMLGSTEKAKALMGDMVNLAAKTPFSLQDVSSGAKQLLAFQVPANEVVDTLTRMGNIAAGLNVPISRINLVYGQVKAKGRLMGDDLRQFTEAGIPMIHELAQSLGKADSEIVQMVTDGKIGFSDVKKVLFDLTNEGGMFYNLMEAQSKSLSGQWSNLQDSLDQMFNSIGQANEGLLSNGIQGLNYLVVHYQDVINIISTLVATYGTYRAALMAASALQKAAMWVEGAQAAIQFAQGISGMTKAQLLFNAAVSANPYIILAAGLAAVVGAVVYFTTKSDEAKNTAQEMAEAVNSATAAAGKETSELTRLYSAATNDAKSRKDRLAAVQQLQKLYPSYFGNLNAEMIMVGKASNKYYELRDAIIASARAKAIGAELERLEGEQLKKEAELRKKLDEDVDNYRKNRASGYKDKTFRDGGDGMGHGTTTVITASDQQKRDQAVIAESVKKIGELRKEHLKNTKYYVDELEKQNEKAGKVDEDRNRKEEHSAEATEKNAKKTKTAAKKHAEAVEQIYSEKSIEGMQQRKAKWEKTMNTSAANSDQWKKAKAEVEKYQAQIDAYNKSLQKKSFDEELSEAKRQIEVRDRLIKSGMPKEEANKLFGIGDKTYIQFLNEMQDKLSAIKNPSLEVGESLFKIKDAISDYNGEPTFIEKMNNEIEALKQKFKGSELINRLEKYGKGSLNVDGLNPLTEAESNARRKAVEKAKEDEIKNQQQLFQQLLSEQKTYEEKSVELQKKYDSLRVLAKNDAERDKIDAAFQKEATDLIFSENQKNPEWAKMFTDMNLVATEKLKEFRAILVGQLNLAKDAESKIKIGEFIKKIDDNISDRNPFIAIEEAIRAMGDGSLSSEEKLAKLAKGIDGVNKYFAVMEGIVSEVEYVVDSLGVKSDSAFRDVLNNVKTTLAGIKEVINGVQDFKSSQKSFQDAQKKGDTFGKAVSGLGMVGAAVSVVIGLYKTLSGWVSGDKKKERNIKKQAAELKELETAYNNLSYAAERAFGSMKYDGQRDLIKNLEQQKAAINGMLNTESSKKKKDASKIADYKSQMQQIDQNINNIKEGIIKDVLQTDVVDAASKVGDALVDAFGRGESAVDSLKNAANDMIKNLLRNQLNLALQNKMKPIIDNLLKSSGFNADGTGSFTGLSKEQIEAFKSQVVAAGQDMQSFLNGYSEIFKGLGDGTQAQGLKGDIKGVTEKTPGALESQINAMRVNQVSGLEVMRSQLLQLSQIQANTYRLHNIDRNIEELNKKTTGKLAGIV